MPGMTDVHVHLTSIAGQPWYQGMTPKYSEAYAATTGCATRWSWRAPASPPCATLAAGRSRGIATRDAIREHGFPGPRVMVSGPALSMIGGHGDDTVGLNPELAAAVDAQRPDRRLHRGRRMFARGAPDRRDWAST